jgi:organic radical activating enzyme
MRRAPVFEIFSSIQGEGATLGERQIFVRFGGCNLHCDYCDEPDSIPAGAGEPWDGERLRSVILSHQSRRPHAAITWTGGEPLLYAPFIAEHTGWARELGLKNHLETNGILAERMSSVVAQMDRVVVDLKLPSATGKNLWAKHAAFLKAAGARAHVKIVLTRAAEEGEWRRAVDLMAKHAPETPLYLQPATPVASSRGDGRRVEPIEAERAVAFLVLARRKLMSVRLLPQFHPMWGLK